MGAREGPPRISCATTTTATMAPAGGGNQGFYMTSRVRGEGLGPELTRRAAAASAEGDAPAGAAPLPCAGCPACRGAGDSRCPRPEPPCCACGDPSSRAAAAAALLVVAGERGAPPTPRMPVPAGDGRSRNVTAPARRDCGPPAGAPDASGEPAAAAAAGPVLLPEPRPRPAGAPPLPASPDAAAAATACTSGLVAVVVPPAPLPGPARPAAGPPPGVRIVRRTMVTETAPKSSSSSPATEPAIPPAAGAGRPAVPRPMAPEARAPPPPPPPPVAAAWLIIIGLLCIIWMAV